MEDVLQGIGWVALILMVVIGAAAGWLAALVAGGHRARYVAIGVIAAVAAPLVIGLLAGGVLLAGGLLAVILMAVIGAAVVLVIAKLVFD
ncbi:GlsB/YeaQ/YmgE family stress response membrane protein [Falsirhodobacter algicola]|uniref:GlsB/YeaQ/YmgE family stress response membrane protein n=1 Tax=Falsirhodobacter algicola TaxID=2692330 RepID=A0A8J8SL20_9RHOB|nr:GlsB/YeaQ/YmgE family stress response membrane protein [Falsirhodobacter algicola]QUS35966.1 GlsB/YeaQ/YmgE family stress response membrane protein [Falsirhodobacter algicola]